MSSQEELLAKAEKPAQDAMRLHPFYHGKVQVTSKCAIRDLSDFAIWYTPGVAAPCKAIFREPEMVYDYTNKGNSIAVVSDGTRVLGLGRIGRRLDCRSWRGRHSSSSISAGLMRSPSACGPRTRKRSSER